MHHYIGLISGTSTDGVDAVVVAISPEKKIGHQFKIIAARMEAIPNALRQRIKSIMNPGNDGVDECGSIDIEIGELFAKAALNVLKESGLNTSEIRAIGSHGQTIRHRPSNKHPFSRQIGDPSTIAQITGIATIADFRSRDIAAGGQGAPLVPAFHQWLFSSSARSRAVLNIGGIANLTFIPTEGSVIGFDTGPGNALLDQWIGRHKNEPYDREGKWASSGTVSEPLLKRLLQDSYFSQPHPKSTGVEYFNMAWLERSLSTLATNIAAQDVQATLAELTAITIMNEVKARTPSVDEIMVCGGGSHNVFLMDALRRYADRIVVDTTERLGLHPDWVEASAFAWLAHCRLENIPGNIPAVTGAKNAAVLGGIYAGAASKKS
jgi:anhydro-N-acetylmuramic acid kinase